MARRWQSFGWYILASGLFVMLAATGCSAIYGRTGSGSTGVAPNVIVPAVNVSSPEDAQRATLSTVLPGTWQRMDHEIFNTFTSDGRYLVDNRQADRSLPEAEYQVVDNNHIRFELADGSSVILEVALPDHNTLILRYPETPYTPAQEMVFERVDGMTEVAELAEVALNLLYYDDFSDATSGWPTARTDQHAYGYRDGGYSIGILRANLLYHVTAPGVTTRNASIEVDATRTSGEAGEMSAAVLCRVMRDPVRFYAFEITYDGYFTITKYVDGRPYNLGIGYERNNAIRRGDATNHIRADCIDDTLTLYVNGTRLAILQDNELPVGGVALAAATFRDFDGTRAEVLFDNLLITER